MLEQTKSYGIEISENDTAILSFLLQNIPDQNKLGLKWCLMYIDGIFKNESINFWRDAVNKNMYGKIVSWDKLMMIVNDFNQAWDFLVLADKDENNSISLGADDNWIYHSSTYVIELFDSSYYRIYSKDRSYIESLKGFFKNSTELL